MLGDLGADVLLAVRVLAVLGYGQSEGAAACVGDLHRIRIDHLIIHLDDLAVLLGSKSNFLVVEVMLHSCGGIGRQRHGPFELLGFRRFLLLVLAVAGIACISPVSA